MHHGSKIDRLRCLAAMAAGYFPVDVTLPYGLVVGTDYPLWSNVALLNAAIRPRLIS